MTTRLSGEEQFDQFYRKQFGVRWDPLHRALNEEHTPILRFTAQNEQSIRALFAQHGLSFQTLHWHKNALLWPKEIPFGTTVPGVAEGLLYIMNPSSLVPPLVLAQLMQHIESPKILDACAAPGGKTLVLADALPRASITANELSAERGKRLRATLAQYGHTEITILKHEAETLFKKMPEMFDAILLDSPCSSEAHVIASEKHLSEWTPNRVKQMQFRQLALLGGLLLALKPGGVLIYSTCSLAPQENESVVEKFLNKRGEHAELLNVHDFFHDIGAQGLSSVHNATITHNSSEINTSITQKVLRIFPDEHHLDPMFVAAFRKK